MMRTINAMGDRLLGLVAPRMTASADECGSVTYQYRCYNGYYQKRKCCSTGGCYNWVTISWGC